MLLGNNVAATNICLAFAYLIRAVVLCQLPNSGPIERPFKIKKILERLVQAIDVIDNPNKPG